MEEPPVPLKGALRHRLVFSINPFSMTLRFKMFNGAEAQIFEKAKARRRKQTHEEELLWSYLKQKPCGFKFRRQHPYRHYILDFYCHAAKLVIEVDGSIHEDKAVKEHDEERQRYLESQGLKVLRFTNEKSQVSVRRSEGNNGKPSHRRSKTE